MIKNRQMLKTLGMILFIFTLSIIFIEPLRTKMNNIFMPRDRRQLKEEGLIGTVIGYNPRVKEAQGVLKNAGFYAGSVDGFMGTQTRKAISNFQDKKGLQATGRINQVTLLALNRESQLPRAGAVTQGEEAALPEKREPPAKEQKKLTIEQIQAALAKANFYKGKIDGIMGPKTKKAVKAFQESRGLKADGVAGPQTQEALSGYLD
ncbi:MAG: peptidoglycan-binding protein [Candidatus Omnitrophota bacterium]|nr:peptidoglycan-binding protein [Candidatus Omnitrophota bacterium]